MLLDSWKFGCLKNKEVFLQIPRPSGPEHPWGFANHVEEAGPKKLALGTQGQLTRPARITITVRSKKAGPEVFLE